VVLAPRSTHESGRQAWRAGPNRAESFSTIAPANNREERVTPDQPAAQPAGPPTSRPPYPPAHCRPAGRTAGGPSRSGPGTCPPPILGARTIASSEAGMARRDPTLVYVHGAGAQPPEADWVRIHNQILFADRPAPPTDLAYYADLIQQFDDPGAGSPVAEPATAKDVLQDSIHQTVAGEGRTMKPTSSCSGSPPRWAPPRPSLAFRPARTHRPAGRAQLLPGSVRLPPSASTPPKSATRPSGITPSAAISRRPRSATRSTPASPSERARRWLNPAGDLAGRKPSPQPAWRRDSTASATAERTTAVNSAGRSRLER